METHRVRHHRDRKSGGHDHRAEIFVVVQEAAAVEARAQHSDEPEHGRQNASAPAGPNALDENAHRRDHQHQPEARVDRQQDASVEDGPGHICATPLKYSGGLAPGWPVGIFTNKLTAMPSRNWAMSITSMFRKPRRSCRFLFMWRRSLDSTR